MLIKDRISELRNDKGLSQKEFAKIINIPYNTYVKYERELNEPDDHVKIKIAKYFNVSVDYLIGFSDLPRPNVEDSSYIKLPHKFDKKLKDEVKQYINMIILREKYGKK